MDMPLVPIKKTEDMKEYMRQYRIKNKEKLKEYSCDYMSDYYATNKDRFYENNIKFRQKTQLCDCGCEIKSYYLPSHKKTQKHINIINAYNKGLKDTELI